MKSEFDWIDVVNFLWKTAIIIIGFYAICH